MAADGAMGGVGFSHKKQIGAKSVARRSEVSRKDGLKKLGKFTKGKKSESDPLRGGYLEGVTKKQKYDKGKRLNKGEKSRGPEVETGDETLLTAGACLKAD